MFLEVIHFETSQRFATEVLSSGGIWTVSLARTGRDLLVEDVIDY